MKLFVPVVGSELKLLKGLKLGCTGIISATCNVTSYLARKVYEDFKRNKDQTQNEKLCKIRKVFDKYDLISGVHSFLSDLDPACKNILPPLTLLNAVEKNQMLSDLQELEFSVNKLKIT